jgi:hypothetical protein
MLGSVGNLLKSCTIDSILLVSSIFNPRHANRQYYSKNTYLFLFAAKNYFNHFSIFFINFQVTVGLIIYRLQPEFLAFSSSLER